MYNVSNRFVNASLSSTREVSAKAVFNGTIEVDSSSIVDLTFEELCVAGDNPTMGEACSNKIVLNMYAPDNPPAYKSGSVEPYVGLTVDEDTVEYCPLGQFYISEYTSVDDYKTVQITAYDKMAMLNDTYTYTAPTTVSAVMSDIANQYDITVEDTDYPAGNLIDKVVKCTVRQMLGYIAGLMGKNVRFNKDGNLEFFWYTSEAVVFGDANNDGEINSTDINYINAHLINKVTGEEYESILGSARAGISYLGGEYDPDAFGVDVNADHIVKADDVAEIQDYIDGHPREGTIVGTKEYPYKATQSNIKMGGFLRLCDEMYEITKLESGSGSNIITSGTEGRMMSFENPFMTQAILDGIRAGLVFEYLPCTITYQGTPAFECGDIIGAIASDGTQYSVPIMTQTFVITGGMHAVINSVGTTDVQSTIEINALEDILEPLEEAVENLEEKVGEESVATQIEAMKEEIQANLSGAEGGKYSIIYEDGVPVGWKIVSNSDPNKLWQFKYGGLQYSSNGGQTFSSTALDYNGNLYATSVTAEGIQAGTISGCYFKGINTTESTAWIELDTTERTTSGANNTVRPDGMRLKKNGTDGTWTYTNNIGYDGMTLMRKSGGQVSIDMTAISLGYAIGLWNCGDGIRIDGNRVLTAGDSSSFATASHTHSGSTIYPGHVGGDGNAPVVYFSTSQTSSAQAGRFSKSGTTFQLTDYSGSSRRFKHDIESLNDEWLDAIHGLYNAEVKRWTYNDDYIVAEDDLYKTETIGLIAEEIADILPTSGITDANGDIENYRERQLINAMLVLIQEQKQQIDELTERVKVLEDGNI